MRAPDTSEIQRLAVAADGLISKRSLTNDEFQRLDTLAAELKDHAQFKEKLRLGDLARIGEVSHDWLNHIKPVRKLARMLIEMVDKAFPGTFTRDDRLEASYTAALHDIGSDEGDVGHAARGADWSYDFLLKEGRAPEWFAYAVAQGVRYHQSENVLRGLITGRGSAAAITADKCSDGRSRVRPENLAELLARVEDGTLAAYRRRGGVDEVNDLANAAIVRSTFSSTLNPSRPVRDKGSIIHTNYVDRRFATDQMIMDLYGKRYAACEILATTYGCTFAVQFIDEVPGDSGPLQVFYVRDRTQRIWHRHESQNVPTANHLAAFVRAVTA